MNVVTIRTRFMIEDVQDVGEDTYFVRNVPKIEVMGLVTEYRVNKACSVITFNGMLFSKTSIALVGSWPLPASPLPLSSQLVAQTPS
jgi:hypothetical protein